MIGVNISRLFSTDYFPAIRRAKISEWGRKWNTDTSKLHNTKPRIEEWKTSPNSCRKNEVRMSRLSVRYSRLIHDI